MNLNRIAQIAVHVKDLERATRFYRDTLGLPALISNPFVTILDCGGMTLLLGKSESGQDKGNSIMYFDVEDIHRTFAELTERNVTVEDKPHVVGQLGNLDVWIAIFKDSEDNQLALMSKVPRSR